MTETNLITGTTWTEHTARCAGLGGCGREFRISATQWGYALARVHNDAVCSCTGDEYSPSMGLAAHRSTCPQDHKALETAALGEFDFCLGCATGDVYVGEYVSLVRTVRGGQPDLMPIANEWIREIGSSNGADERRYYRIEKSGSEYELRLYQNEAVPA